jgi:hypothetical protein
MTKMKIVRASGWEMVMVGDARRILHEMRIKMGEMR